MNSVPTLGLMYVHLNDLISNIAWLVNCTEKVTAFIFYLMLLIVSLAS